MLEIYLQGHDNYYGIADVMRAFYLRPTEDKENSRVFCSDAPDMAFVSAAGTDFSSCITGDGEVSVTLPFVTDPVSISREVKRSCYVALSEFLGKKAPWGCLTGIRPTLVAGETEGPVELSEKYFVRPDKAELAVRTYANEQKVLGMVPGDAINIYVGIPFCPSRCEYCSFISSDISHHMDRLGRYLDALEEEIKIAGPAIDRRISTLYLGGGTPTVFDDKDFDRLLDVIYGNLKPGSAEVTVEAGRPDTITEHKLRSMADHGVRRICINPQTMNSGTLSKLNRLHSAEDTVRVFEMARKAGFDIINMDLIAGLKYETASDFTDSVNKLIGLRPENITIHTLYKKRRAAISAADVLTDDNNEVDDAVREGYELLDKAGYIPYYMYRQKDTGHGLENTGFALPGTECLYNVAMMTDARDVLSFGAGGMSKRVFGSEGNKYRVERCPCIKDVIGYMNSSREMAERKMRFFGII